MSLTYNCLLSSPQSLAQKKLLTQNHHQHQHSKVSTSRKLKNILKPVLIKIFKTKLKSSIKHNSYKSATEEDLDFQWIQDNNNIINDNLANEELENRLIEEIQDSTDDSAIFIFNENGQNELNELNKNKFYIPVNFVRTNAGTFFWTTSQKQPIQPFQIEWNFLDRWGQA